MYIFFQLFFTIAQGSRIERISKINFYSAQWQWSDGSSSSNINPVWGDKGSFSLTNNPGSRSQGAMWNANNDIYLWSGFGNYGIFPYTSRSQSNFS